MIDGGTLDWEMYKPLDGMSAVDKNKLTVAKIEEEEKLCAKKNAWYVAEQLTQRIDDKPGPGGDFMIANVSESKGKHIVILGRIIKIIFDLYAYILCCSSMPLFKMLVRQFKLVCSGKS